MSKFEFRMLCPSLNFECFVEVRILKDLMLFRLLLNDIVLLIISDCFVLKVNDTGNDSKI